VLTLPQLAGGLVEARLVLWAMRGDPRRWIGAAQATICACALAGAFATSPWALGIALAIAGPASGVSSTLAVSALVEASPRARECAMTRWTLASALGDLVVPLVVAGIAWAGLPWRATLVLVAVLLGAHAVAIVRGPLLTVALDAAEREERDVVTLGGALRTPLLLVWLAALTACTLLDEILVAFAALHFRQNLGASEVVTAGAIGAWAAGWTVGLLAVDRLLARTPARPMLLGACVVCAAAVLGWLAAPSPLLAAVGLFAVGVASAPLYPIASAQAYAACPGRAALVDVASHLFTPFEIALPWLIGLLADTCGLRIALATLVLQPLVLLLVTWLAWPPARLARQNGRHARDESIS